MQKDNRLLMVIRSEKEEHAGGLLSFIGGKVEFADSADAPIINTLKREILEEVGVTIQNPRFVTSTGFTADDGVSVVNIVFLCDWAGGVPRVVDPDEVAEVMWMTIDEIRQHDKTPIWLSGYIELIADLMAE